MQNFIQFVVKYFFVCGEPYFEFDGWIRKELKSHANTGIILDKCLHLQKNTVWYVFWVGEVVSLFFNIQLKHVSTFRLSISVKNSPDLYVLGIP